MAMNGMGFTFSARDMASGTFSRISRGMKKLEGDATRLQARYDKAMKGMRTGAAMAVGGAVALAGMNKAHKAFADFELQIVSAGKKMHATAGEMKALASAARKAGIETQFSPAQAAEALSEMASMGAKASEAMKALDPTLQLAAASMGKLGVADAAKVGMVALNSYGMTVDKIGGVMNDLANVANNSAFQYNDFQIAISQAGGTAKIAGQDFQGMLASMALLRDAGFGASRAATQYREAVRRMTGDPGALKVLKKMGVAVLDSSGNFRQFAHVVADLHPKLQKLNKTQKMTYLRTLFGARGMNAYAAQIAAYEKLVRKGTISQGDFAGAHQRLVDKMKTGKTTLNDYTAAVKKSAWGQRQLLKGSWDTFVISFGKLLNKHLIPIIKKFIGVLNEMIKWIEGLPSGLREVIGKVLVFGTVLITLVGIFKVLKGLWAMFKVGRLLGKYVAGQAAATAATTTTTTAINAQAAASTRAATGMGRLRGIMMKGLGYAALAYGAYEAGKALGFYLAKAHGWIDMLKNNKAHLKFHTLLRQQNRLMKKAQGEAASYRSQIAKTGEELLRLAAKGPKSFEQAMLKTSAALAGLHSKRRTLMWQLMKSFHDKDAAGVAKAQSGIMKLNSQMQVMRETQIHMTARNAKRRLRFVKDETQRRMLAQTVLTSMVVKQANLEASIMERQKKQKAGLAKITDPGARKAALQAFEKAAKVSWEKIQTGRKAIGTFGARHGMAAKGATPDAGYGQAMQQTRMGRQAMGGRQMAMSQKVFAAASKGEVMAGWTNLTNSQIKFMAAMREASLNAIKTAPAAVKQEMTRYLGALYLARRKSVNVRGQGRQAAEPMASAPATAPGPTPMIDPAEIMKGLPSAAGQKSYIPGMEPPGARMKPPPQNLFVDVVVKTDKVMQEAVKVSVRQKARNGGTLKTRVKRAS